MVYVDIAAAIAFMASDDASYIFWLLGFIHAGIKSKARPQ
jgi:hypothetical protein